MTELLTAAQMRAIEQAAIDSGQVTGLELMERAGRGVVEAIMEWRPELATAPHRAVVLCGPGNNGGDGFVVARLLRERGWEVEVFLYGDEAKLKGDAAENARRWREMGGPIKPYEDERVQAEPSIVDGADVIIDALFGTGLTRPVEGIGRMASFSEVRCDVTPAEGPPWFVAVDIPSGLCADSGRAITCDKGGRGPFEMDQMFAHLTVTFHRAKLGHYLADGPWRCGTVSISDIGLRGETEGASDLVKRDFLEQRHLLVRLRKGEFDHKYSHGHVLVLAGGAGAGGAGRLAARGALRVGAGAVTVGVPPAAVNENAAQLDAIMLRPVEDLGEFLSGPRSKMNALCLGMGLGRGERTRDVVAAACRSKRRLVLDADALTSFEEAPQELFALLHEHCVLTPHLGEFGRLFPDLREKLTGFVDRGPAYSKLGAAREAAARAGATVLIKGADTAIAHPSGRGAISAASYVRSAPWLATAGAGDVLAGLIAGLMARSYYFAPFEAATTAAWLHVECALRFGPGLIAEDLPEQLPAVFRDLGL